MRMALVVVGILVIYIIFQAAYTGYYYLKSESLIKKVYIGERTIGKVSNPKFNLFVDGDSVGAGVGASAWDKSVAGRVASYYSEKYSVGYVNNSKVGAQMADLAHKQLPHLHPNLTILVISSNDLFHFTNLSKFEISTKEVLARYSEFSDKVILIGPGRVFDAAAIPIIIKPLYKIQGNKYAKIIDKESKNYPNVIYVNPLNTSVSRSDYGPTNGSDGFHPNDEGHRFWFDLIKPHLD
jgi:lysophospholipase L1-like esterase